MIVTDVILAQSERTRRYGLWLSRFDDAPLWHRPQWLDATAGPGAWDVALLMRSGALVAALPYVLRHSRALGVVPYSTLTTPPLTQALGPWWPDADDVTLDERFRRVRELFEQLPTADAYVQNWVPEMDSWLPLHWDGYRQTTRYTYRVSLRASHEERMQAVRSTGRNKLRKADRAGVSVERMRDDNTGERLYRLIESTFRRQGLRVPYGIALLDRILGVGGAGIEPRVYAAMLNGRDVAMALVVAAGGVSYNLATGSDDDGRAIGAGQALLWHAMNAEAEAGSSVFDFEGSMIQGVERHYRHLGGCPTSYHHVERFHRRDIRLGVALRGALRP